MLVEMPGLGTVDASEEHAKVLLAAGWSPVEKPDEGKRAPAKRRTRRNSTKKSG